MKTLVVYYSCTGSTRYVAEKLAGSLNADSEALKPRMNVLPFIMIFSLLGISPGIARLRHTPAAYDRVILCGPVWAGMLLAPLRTFLRKYRKGIRKLYFVCTCGSGDDDKDGRFGYETVFKKVRTAAGNICAGCVPFSISLIIPDELKGNNEAIMKLRFNDETFTGDVADRFDAFVAQLKGTS